MRRPTVLLLSLLLLLGLAAACSRARNDNAIATDIKAKMFADPQLKSANLDVSVKDGEVTLKGEVPDDATRYQAYKIATQTQGVTKVNDLTTVTSAAAPPPEISEAEPAPAPQPEAPRKVVRKRAPRAAPVESQPEAPAAPPAPAEAARTAPAAVPAPPPPPQPKHVEIPAGTELNVRMIDSIDSSVNHAGEIFRASLDTPIVVEDQIVVPTGTDMFVKLVEAKSAGRIAGRSELRLDLSRMQFQDKSYTLATTDVLQAGGSRGKQTATRVGIGTAIGAAIGAIAGGGKGAAIGAGVGAAGGTGVQIATKGQQVRVPAETKLTFRLEQPVEVTYFPERNRSRR